MNVVMIYLLLIILIAIFIINLRVFNFSFSAPAVIFSASFVFSTIWAVAYATIWNTTISDRTLFIIIGGTVIYSIICSLCSSFNNKIYTKNAINYCGIEVSNSKTILLIVIELLVLLIYVRSIRTSTGLSQLSSAINSLYRQESELSLPLYIRVLIIFVRGAGYWFSYIFVINAYYKKKCEWLSLVAIAISVVCSALTGSRGNAVCILGSLIAYFLLLHSSNNSSVKLKPLLLVILLITVGLWIFPRVSNFLGRTTTIKPLDYLAAYLGAEPYTLDSFLKWNEVPVNSGTWGIMTFYSLISSLGKYMGFSFQRPAVYHYYYSNGYFMGNVNTVFFEPLCDFGYVGYLVVIAVYAMISQIIYDKARRCTISKSAPFSILLYGYLFAVLAVSFFSWWFGNFFISTSFIYILLSWALLNVFFFRLKFIIKF